ncbi:MAG TPA: MBOAT family protein, partial [Porphyromonadaceae bacterium]|nr:MBOAT family protein [Porphyromonadaceae bacterium]
RLSDKLLGERTAAGQTVALVARMATSCVILLVSVALLVGATNNAFLYTRF